MTRALRSLPSLPLPATVLLASALVAAAPAAAAAGPAERAVAACRAEMTSRFADGEIRSHRVASIAGNSRRTRVRIIVNADRRYNFECATGRDGSIEMAAFDPPRAEERQLAAGQR